MQNTSKFVQEFEAGQPIFIQGQPGNEMYVVVSGLVEISKGSDTSKTVVATLGRGEMFGEMALVASGSRMASATAIENQTRVVCIDQARFVYLVSQQPAFALSVMRMMAHRLAGKPLEATEV